MTTTPPCGTGGWPARFALARRDLLEFVRDRRALFITLVMPMAMYPLLALSSTLGIRSAIGELDRRDASVRVELAFSGPDAAGFAARVGAIANRTGDRPADWPESLAVRLIDAADALPLIDEGAADAWIDFPAGTLERLGGDGTVPLEVRLSTVRPPDRRIKERIVTVLRGVADEVRLERLRRLRLPATLIEPLAVDFTGDLPPTSASAVREILPTAAAAVLVLLALLTATGAFYPAVDAIAGEKERGTIETLLIAPCSPFDVVAGKFLAVFAVTLATLLANAVSILLTITVLVRVLPGASLASVAVGEAAACGTVIVAAYVGLAAVAAALCLAVTAAAKSGKEAQNTLTPVVMLIAALAGSALLPGAAGRRWLPAAPFAGQVAVARSVLSTFDDGTAATFPPATDTRPPSVATGLAMSLVSSAVATWLLLLATAALITSEETLFRGPDAASTGCHRPAPRPTPTAWQGFAAVLAGFAALWYAQGLAPAAFVPALLAQQAVAVLVPLLIVSWWQRVDARETFGLRLPGGPVATVAAVAGAAAVGVGLFGSGAAATLALWGSDVSPEARDLATRLVTLVRESPPWLAALVLAVMPAACEELFFRGWLLAAFAGERPAARRRLVAITVQAAMFAAFHLLPERMPQTLLVGLVLGWMTLATRSLLPAIVAHAVHNATPVALVAMATDADLTAIEAGSGSLPPGMLAGSIGCLLVGGIALAVTAHRQRTQEGRS
ncbi:MAG: ABC transporter permease subunit [Pirellulales bacterium]